MNFIQAKNGRRYATERFISIGEPETRRGEGITEVDIEGCGMVEFYNYVIRDFLRQPIAMLPAQPETYVIYADDESPGGYFKTSVVGWSASRDGRLYPITAEGVNDDVDTVVSVVTPDGKVSRFEDRQWSSIEAFLEDQKSELLAAE